MSIHIQRQSEHALPRATDCKECGTTMRKGTKATVIKYDGPAGVEIHAYHPKCQELGHGRTATTLLANIRQQYNPRFKLKTFA